MQEAAVEPDVGQHVEHDRCHQGEMDAPGQARGAWAPVAQEGAHGQLDEKDTQGHCG